MALCQAARSVTVLATKYSRQTQGDNGKDAAVREYADELQPHVPDCRPDGTEQTEQPAYEEPALHAILATATLKRKCSEDERESEEHIPRKQPSAYAGDGHTRRADPS